MTRNFKEEIDQLYEDFNNAGTINENNLFTIIKDNIDTPLGRKYGFETINSIEDYQKAVPMSTAGDYPDGNEYTYSVGYNLATSGTLGNRKRFTVSNLAMEKSAGYNYIMPFYLLDMTTEKGLNISVFQILDHDMLLSSALYDYLYKNNYFKLEDYYDCDFLFSDTIENIPYIKAYIALAHKDIRYFDSIFLYDMLIVFKYMIDNHEMLLDDIRNRRFSVNLSDAEKEKLLRQNFTEERLNEIEKIFSKESDEPLIKRLFPDLKFVSGVGGGKYKIYDSKLKELIGDDTPVFYYIFAQTECTMGVPLKMNEPSYAMMPATCFYEYLDLDTGKVYLPQETVIGTEYEPIVTTFSGLYRYHTGDRVCVKEKVGQAPVVGIKGRINSIINIAGEKVDDADITLTMDKMKDVYNFTQFAVGVDSTVYPNRYIIFVDVGNCDDNFAERFDNLLMSLAFDYKDLRMRGAISTPVVKVLDVERFYDIQKGQVKPKVVLNDEQVQKWMKE